MRGGGGGAGGWVGKKREMVEGGSLQTKSLLNPPTPAVALVQRSAPLLPHLFPDQSPG